jgi:branched-chain amino acid transport system ATP-binding protein
MLELSGVSVSIGPVGILRNVDLKIPTGKFAGLIGRNGAGKTTLLRTIMGILANHDGSIQFDGRDLTRVPTYRRVELGIGYMPEDRRLVPGLTVEQNVLLPSWAHFMADSAKRLEDIYVRMPEVKAFRARKALQLSGGQQKLVALARAMMAGPKLLLLDEPFEGVAPVLARRLAEVIASLRKTGLTVILSESTLIHAHGLLDGVFNIDRGAVTRRT